MLVREGKSIKETSTQDEEEKAHPFTLLFAITQPKAAQTIPRFPSVSTTQLGEPSQHRLETLHACAPGCHSFTHALLDAILSAQSRGEGDLHRTDTCILDDGSLCL